MLRINHLDASSMHPKLNISYEEAVGAQANVFLSFAYGDNFIELVGALEQSSMNDPAKFNRETTCYWFDMFVNNQWVALDKPFEWWASTFRNAVKKIGNTVCYFSPWNDPSSVKRAWCLYEISCGDSISIVMSDKQKSDFQHTLRNDYASIMTSLCKIDLENATSHLPEDREKIFTAVRAIEGGGFDGFNNKVVGLIRDWIAASTRAMVEGHGDNIADVSINSNENYIDNNNVVDGDASLTVEQLRDLNKAGLLLSVQGKLDEAKVYYERALKGREIILGPNHADTLSSVSNLGNLLSKQGKLDEAKVYYERAFIGAERVLGPEHPDTKKYSNNLRLLKIHKVATPLGYLFSIGSILYGLLFASSLVEQLFYLFFAILFFMSVSKKLINMRKIYKAFNALYYVIVIVIVILSIICLYMEYTGDLESITKADTKEL